MLTRTLYFPDLGTDDAAVIEILVQIGQAIILDQPLVLLESAKASMEIPATTAGRVQDILVVPGQSVQSGDALLVVEMIDAIVLHEPMAQTLVAAVQEVSAFLTTDAVAEPTAISSDQPDSSNKVRAETVFDPPPSPPPLSLSSPQSTELHAGPAVRRMARELGVDLCRVSGSGPHQRILKSDVETYIRQQLHTSQDQPELNPQEIDSGIAVRLERQKTNLLQAGAVYAPFTRIQRLSAEHLAKSHAQVVPVTQFAEADITELEQFRQKQRESAQAQGFSVTILPFLVKVMSAALKKYPRFNSEFGLNAEGVYLKSAIHIAFAVDTEQGLLVPVLKHCADVGIFELAQRIMALSQSARTQSLKPEEMSQGSITISSLGSIGGTAFTPVINWPQVAILGVAQARMQPVWQGGAFQPRLMLPLALTYDHRVIDGALAVRFLVDYAAMLADIRRLLL